MTDNVAVLKAVLKGFTKKVYAIGQMEEMHILVRPGTDFDDGFAAWDMDNQEFVWIDGWLWEFERVE